MTLSGRKIAVTLCPGGLPGLDCHAGAWLAFEKVGLIPSQLLGCSAGAIVGSVWAAGGMTAVEFSHYLGTLDSTDLIKKRFAWKERIFWIDHFCDPSPIENKLENMLPPSFADLKIPLTVVATRMDVVPEYSERFECGNILRQAVRASMSIAGVWPYAKIGDRTYSDGGTTKALPLPSRLDEFDAVIVINLQRKVSFPDRDKNMISRLLWNIEQLQDLEPDRARYYLSRKHNVHWLDLPVGNSSSLDFSPDHLLIGQSYQITRAFLAEKVLPFLALSKNERGNYT